MYQCQVCQQFLKIQLVTLLAVFVSLSPEHLNQGWVEIIRRSLVQPREFVNLKGFSFVRVQIKKLDLRGRKSHLRVEFGFTGGRVCPKALQEIRFFISCRLCICQQLILFSLKS